MTDAERKPKAQVNLLKAKDAVFDASIEFIGTLTGMTPPPIETAPAEVLKPFKDFTDRVCEIFVGSMAIKDREIEVLTERVKVLEDTAQAVIECVDGDLPTRGWMRDCDKSRKALHELKAAMKGTP